MSDWKKTIGHKWNEHCLPNNSKLKSSRSCTAFFETIFLEIFIDLFPRPNLGIGGDCIVWKGGGSRGVCGSV